MSRYPMKVKGQGRENTEIVFRR